MTEIIAPIQGDPGMARVQPPARPARFSRQYFAGPGRGNAGYVQRTDQHDRECPGGRIEFADQPFVGSEQSWHGSRRAAVHGQAVTGHVQHTPKAACYRGMDTMVVLRGQVDGQETAAVVIALRMFIAKQSGNGVVHAFRLNQPAVLDRAGLLHGTVDRAAQTVRCRIQRSRAGQQPAGEKIVETRIAFRHGPFGFADIDGVEPDETADQRILEPGCLDPAETVHQPPEQESGQQPLKEYVQWSHRAFAVAGALCKESGGDNNAVTQARNTPCGMLSMPELPDSPRTIGQAIDDCAARLDCAGVYFGHGTDNALDEAAALVLAAAGLDHDDPAATGQTVSPETERRIDEFMHERIEQRVPLPYITGEAWFAGLKFRVDRRVLIPRSPFAELLAGAIDPWLPSRPVRRILEIGTGSGCIAIAAALAFPDSRVVATDVSVDALELARINRARHGLDDRIDLVCADLFDGLCGRFDLILSNPPYVPEQQRDELPAEYAHEPGLALYSGADGLDSPRRILQDAAGYLSADGLLALEVGDGWARLEAAFPRLAMIWPEFESGGEGIALVTAQALQGQAAVR